MNIRINNFLVNTLKRPQHFIQMVAIYSCLDAT